MSRILVLGAGFVAAPLVDYLYKKSYQLTIANQDLDEAHRLVGERSGIKVTALDVTDDQQLSQLVSEHDLVISLVPYLFHVAIAKQCLAHAKHLVTASYQSPEMFELNQQAIDKGLTFINEVGLDPGIDHLSAMKIIDEIHEQGGKLEAFVSWCGGLPAPSANDNPLGYKFAWAPRGVLLALLNSAQYIKQGEVVNVAGDELLASATSFKINDQLSLEGYANRDSVSYQKLYGIQEAQTLLRGTLRYQGFSAILQACKNLGLLSTEQDLNHYSSWYELIKRNQPELQAFLNELDEPVLGALEWLGILSKDQAPKAAECALDSFCDLLIAKLAYKQGEHDMIVLQHKFVSVNRDGETEHHRSTLILEGDDQYSAMAKTVGTPAAIAADMICTGEISRKGVILPMTADIYQPMLDELAKQGIELTEVKEPTLTDDFIGEI
jgi:saccharopine dehydrogenase (NADP+, L-glutamate forming)